MALPPVNKVCNTSLLLTLILGLVPPLHWWGGLSEHRVRRAIGRQDPEQPLGPGQRLSPPHHATLPEVARLRDVLPEFLEEQKPLDPSSRAKLVPSGTRPDHILFFGGSEKRPFLPLSILGISRIS